MQSQKQPVVDKLIPIGFRVLVNMYQKSNETSSGMLLPETEHNGMPAMAQITVLGKKTIYQKFLMLIGLKRRYKIGDWVYFRKYSVDELKMSTSEGDLSLYVLEENEIIGLVN